MADRPRRKVRPRRRRGERGAAFLLAVLVAAIVVPIAIEVAFVSRVESSVSTRYARAAERRILGRSGVEIARQVLAADPDRYDHPTDGWARIAEVEASGLRLRIDVEDEARRFPANTVVRPDGTLSIARKKALADVLLAAGLGRAPADVVVDWIDPDDDPLPNGAEAPVYAALAPPRRPPNRPLLSPDEFDRLAGFDAGAAAAAREALTPWGGKVNANTASPAVLAGLGLPKPALDRLVSRRTHDPIESWEEFVEATGLPPAALGPLEALVGFSSDHFRVVVRVEDPDDPDDAFVLTAVLDRGDGLRPVYWRES